MMYEIGSLFLFILIIIFVNLGHGLEEVKYLKLGFISPTDGPFGYTTTASATTMAIVNAQRDGYLKDVNVTYVTLCC